MDIFGISPSRPSQPRPGSRGSSSSHTSISLEVATYVPEDFLPNHQSTQPRTTPPPYNPAKSPLLLFQPQETYFTTKPREPSPEDGCPLLPSVPSSPSTPSVTNPMELYLQDDNSTENRMVRLQAIARDQSASLARQSSLKQGLSQSSSDRSSWQFVDKAGDEQACTSGPASHPGNGHRIEGSNPSPRPATHQNNPFDKMKKVNDITAESCQSAWEKLPRRSDSVISNLCLSAEPSAKRRQGPIDEEQVDKIQVDEAQVYEADATQPARTRFRSAMTPRSTLRPRRTKVRRRKNEETKTST